MNITNFCLKRNCVRGVVFVLIFVLSAWAGSLLPSCETLTFRAEKIYGASPPVNYMLYSVDPSLMAGLNFELWDHEKAFMEEVAGLPILGGWFGQGRTPNMEMVAKVRPDLVMVWNYRADYERIVAGLGQLDIPACYMELNVLEDYPAAYRTIGRITGRNARGEALAEDFSGRLARLKKRAAEHAAKQKVKVYYAQGMDGLRTECHTSVHAELIEAAGAYNVHRCVQQSAFGMEQITAEALLSYDPDVIIVHQPAFFERVWDDPRFKSLRAVREKRVYQIPRVPINWFDRPPSFMRILGLEWLMAILYPEAGLDVESSAKRFFRTYTGHDLDEAELADILRGGPKCVGYDKKGNQ